MLYDLCLTEQSISRQTDKAVCFLTSGRDIWVPKAVLTWMDKGRCNLPTAGVPLWFAKRNGLIGTARDFGH